jgi:large subunit ribosomal protein L11
MADFCKQFNERTKLHVKDTPLPVVLSAFNNRTFSFVVRTPPTSWLIKKSIGLAKGAAK